MNYQSFWQISETQANDTIINVAVAGRPKLITRALHVGFRCAGTLNLIAFLRPIARTTLQTAVAPTDTQFFPTTDPGTGTTSGVPAANDYWIVMADNGLPMMSKATGWTAGAAGVMKATGLALFGSTGNGATVATSFPYAAAAGNSVYFLGAPTDPHNVVNSCVVSARTFFGGYGNVGVFGGLKPGDPIGFYSANATAACFLDAAGGYAKVAGG